MKRSQVRGAVFLAVVLIPYFVAAALYVVDQSTHWGTTRSRSTTDLHATEVHPHLMP